MQLMEYVKESTMYWNFKGEYSDYTTRKIRFGRGCGYVPRETAR